LGLLKGGTGRFTNSHKGRKKMALGRVKGEWMAPKRRFLSALFGGRVDRIPVGNPTSIATVELMELTGCFFPEAHLEPYKIADLAASGHEVLGYDTIMPYFSVQIEAPALGCKMDWGDQSQMPDCVTHPFAGPEDITIPIEKYIQSTSIQAILEAIRILRKRYPDVAIMGKCMGPWTLAYHGFGVQNFLLMTAIEQEKVHAILKILTEYTIAFAREQVKAGADVISLPDHATGDLVGPKMYREYLPHLHKEISYRIGAPSILHICGNTLNRIEDITTSNWDCFHYDTKTDVVKAKQIIGRRMSLIGGINDPQTLFQGTPEDVKREARYAVEAGVEILAPECAIPTSTPIENLKAIVEAAREISGSI
jgi:[methyl-Co(III) methanol-specific corrinoid protein]:coenzyme M methyltransferase